MQWQQTIYMEYSSEHHKAGDQHRPPTQCLLQAELEPPPRQNVVIKLDDAANRSRKNGEQHDWAS